MEKQRKRTKYFVTIGMLSSIGFLLHLLNFPIPPFPAFLKVDFSDMPALLAVITMGPAAGILVELFKNVLDWLFTGTETGVPVGHIANFTTGVLFIMPVYMVFNRFKSVKGLITGLIAGTLVMAVGMSFLNYAVFLPMYTYFLGMDQVVGDALYVMIIKGILPFNIIKGIIITVIMVLLYKAMDKWIIQQQKQYHYQ
ncbi:riboflavin transporter FmnP [Lysinibacillus sp. BF-4]|uniref:ECF transporter S component n=1 Tax=Lysinibacillus sp. BF-4 TaxID=1473546 RepID=UPI000507103D|nr:ECF transporter S component [Lysinibacillus sp. BF-4]KFL44473.1 riboflavin transporter FmnP [Lysinibacillus sp. BF-4]